VWSTGENKFFLTDSNWFTIQFLSLTRQTKEPLRGFRLFWTIIQLTSININRIGENNRCSLPEEYFDCGNLNGTSSQSLCIRRSLVCDGHVHCQPISNNDELSSNCIPQSHLISSSSTFFRQHLILIIIVFSLCIIMFTIAIILIILLIKTKRRHEIHLSKNGKKKRRHIQKQHSSKQSYLSNDQDLSGINMLEQAVTTV